MPKYEKTWLSEKSKEYGVVRDTFEKVCRLRDVLKFFDDEEIINRIFEHPMAKWKTNKNHK